MATQDLKLTPDKRIMRRTKEDILFQSTKFSLGPGILTYKQPPYFGRVRTFGDAVEESVKLSDQLAGEGYRKAARRMQECTEEKACGGADCPTCAFRLRMFLTDNACDKLNPTVSWTVLAVAFAIKEKGELMHHNFLHTQWQAHLALAAADISVCVGWINAYLQLDYEETGWWVTGYFILPTDEVGRLYTTLPDAIFGPNYSNRIWATLWRGNRSLIWDVFEPHGFEREPPADFEGYFSGLGPHEGICDLPLKRTEALEFAKAVRRVGLSGRLILRGVDLTRFGLVQVSEGAKGFLADSAPYDDDAPYRTLNATGSFGQQQG
jgi:hypothetical protein